MQRSLGNLWKSWTEYLLFRKKQCINKYYEKLKLQFFDGNTLFGEAHISLGFYIENNLPLIIDNIPITNKFD
jgi:hypothetical protein